MNKPNLKSQRAITLIALIITIIVLLVLAVVAIGVVENSGIIGHAQNSSNKFNTEKTEENTILDYYENQIAKYYNNKKNVTYTKEGVPIPTGFYYVTGTKDTGVVISDNLLDENNENGKSGNQFVWVPVTEDISTTQYKSGSVYIEPDVITGGDGKSYDAVVTNLQRAECIENPKDNDEILTVDDFKTELTNVYKKMAESVNMYDGFYVGRYETSRNGTNPESKYGATSAYDSNIENGWYSLYALCKRYKTSTVQGSMIWGIQYDKMMDWMGDKANITIEDKRNQKRTCGTTPEDVIKNVYDLYGNSFEWTLERNGGYRVNRGGGYRHEGRPINRGNGFPTDTLGYRAARLALYIV